MGARQISAVDLHAWLGDSARAQPALLDVREAWELERCRMTGSVHIPMREVSARIGELAQDREIVVICHHGGRSFAIAQMLAQAGFAHVYNLHGGIDAWARLVDPDTPRY